MYSQHKPRFNRSTPTVKASDLKRGRTSGRFAKSQGVRWRTVSMKTLGYLAAAGKVTVLQVHHLIGEKANKEFIKSFFSAIDLYNPDEEDMRQINLFSHLLF